MGGRLKAESGLGSGRWRGGAAADEELCRDDEKREREEDRREKEGGVLFFHRVDTAPLGRHDHDRRDRKRDIDCGEFFPCVENVEREEAEEEEKEE